MNNDERNIYEMIEEATTPWEYQRELLAELRDIQKARRDILRNGQSVSMSGAFSSTRVKLDELRKREREIKREIAELSGVELTLPERVVPRYD